MQPCLLVRWPWSWVQGWDWPVLSQLCLLSRYSVQVSFLLIISLYLCQSFPKQTNTWLPFWAFCVVSQQWDYDGLIGLLLALKTVRSQNQIVFSDVHDSILRLAEHNASLNSQLLLRAEGIAPIKVRRLDWMRNWEIPMRTQGNSDLCSVQFPILRSPRHRFNPILGQGPW